MTQKICVFGTSIAWGAWDHEKGGWVTRLRLGLEQDYKVFVYNCGVSGDTTMGMLERLSIEAQVRHASAIIIAVGVNDSSKLNGEYKVSPEDFKKNLYKLVDQAREFTDRVIVVSPSQIDDSKLDPVPWHLELSFSNDDVLKYIDIMREVAEDLNLPFVDNTELLGVEDLDEDGLHPNPQGHEKIHRAVRMAVLEHIPIKKV